MNDDDQLLRRYAEDRSEPAFAELVSRHIDLVYSAALRLVGGDAHLAQDVAQTVFADLARKARALSHHRILTGWLYQATRFAASKAVRTERRRALREKEAVAMQEFSSDANWEQLRPVLDEAMGRLGAKDRDALLLRYFERKELRAVGDALGTSEEAARKRVGRALERLRRHLTGRDVTLSMATLATTLTGSAVQAAPAALAGMISTAVITGAATAAAGSTFTLLNLMNMTKLKAGLLGAAVVAGTGTTVLVQQQSVSQLRSENDSLREQSSQLERLRSENQQLAGLRANADELERLRSELGELHRLRAEVARLRQEKEDAARLQAENARLRERLALLAAVNPQTAGPTSDREAINQPAIERLNQARNWMLAFYSFADEHEGVIPADLAQASAKYPDAFKAEGMSPDQWEIVYAGKFSDIKEPGKVIVIREKQPWYDAQGRQSKAYGFADGHSEVHHSPDGDFERWEAERIVSAGVQ